MKNPFARPSRTQLVWERLREIAQRTGIRDELKLVLPSAFGMIGVLIVWDVIMDKVLENPENRPLESAIR